MALTFTQSELDALQRAYASGVLVVEYDGKRVTYGNADDLKSRLDQVAKSLSQQAGNPQTRRIGIYAGKGLL